MPPAPTYSERQLGKQQAEQRLQQQLASARRQADELRAANARLQQQVGRGDKGDDKKGNDDDGDEDMDCEETLESMPEEERQRRIEAIRGGMAYIELQYGAESPEMEKAKGDIEALQKASRECKPFKTHRAQLEKRKERLQRQQAKANEEADALLVQVEELQSKLNRTREGISTRAKQITAVDDELKELLRRALAEGTTDEGNAAAGGGVQTAEAAAAAWKTFSATLTAMATQPGMPPGWAEQMAGLMAQMQAAAVAIHQRAAETQPLPATAPAAGSGTKPAPLSAEPAGRRWMGPGGGGGAGKATGDAQSGKASSSIVHPSPPKLAQSQPRAASPPLALGKLAADSAAATDQERAVAAAARAAATTATNAEDAMAAAAAIDGDRDNTQQQQQQQQQLGISGTVGAADGGGNTGVGGGGCPPPAADGGDDDNIDCESIFADAEDGSGADGMDLDRREDESVQEHRRRLGKMAAAKLRERRSSGRKGRAGPY